MHRSKLLGDKLNARDFDIQVKVIHTRMVVLNKLAILDRPYPHCHLNLNTYRKL